MDLKVVIQQIKTGDYSELEKVYTAFREEFYRWINKQYKCSPDDAQDIYQQSMIVFYENIVNDKITRMDSSLKTYLFAIGKNKYYELGRDRHRQHEELNEELQHKAEEEPNLNTEEEMDRTNRLELSLEKLGNPCKSLLELYYYHKKSMQEIAEQLGLKNTDTAKNMKYKCLQRLKNSYNLIIP